MPGDPTVTSASLPSPYQFYVTVDGSKQGTFKSNTASGAGNQDQGRIAALRFSYEVDIPQAVGTSTATPVRTYSPLTITKEWDAASPQFFAAAVTNEILRTVLFEFMTISQSGQETTFYTITLTSATISSYRQYTAGLPEGGSNTFELEDVSFVFQKIDIANVAANTSASDSVAIGRISTPTGTISVNNISPIVRSPARIVPGLPSTASGGWDITQNRGTP